MSFLYNTLNSLWNTTTSYFPGTVKYCETNNISWTTTGNLASEIGFIAKEAPLAAAAAVGIAAMNAASEVAAATHALAYGAKDLLAKSAYSALEQTHAWQFETAAGKSDGAAKSSSTMVAELASAAGSNLLDFGYAALKSGYAALADKTTQLGSAAWSEIKVQTPALGVTLLGGVEYVASKVVEATQQGQEILSTKPLDLGTPNVLLAQDDVLKFSDIVFVAADDVQAAFAPGRIETRFSDDIALALQAQPAIDSPADFATDCVALNVSDAWHMPSIIGCSLSQSFC